ILSNPANDNVTDYVEEIKSTQVEIAQHIMEEPTAVATQLETPSEALRIMVDEGMSNILVVDKDEQLIGYVTREEVESLLHQGHDDISSVVQSDVPEVESGALIDDLFDVIHDSETPIAVTSNKGELEGVIVRSNVIDAITIEKLYDLLTNSENDTLSNDSTKEELDHG